MNKLILAESHDPVLKQIATPISIITSEHRDLARMMIKSMKDSDGIGLAAPQIGKSITMAVVYVKKQHKRPIVMYNPVIISKSTELDYMVEGCLSYPGLNVDVERPISIKVKYMNGKNESVVLSATGLLARCIQHEVDHLNGVTLIDFV